MITDGGHTPDPATLITTLAVVKEVGGVVLTVSSDADEELNEKMEMVQAAEANIPIVEHQTKDRIEQLERQISATKRGGEAMVENLREDVARGKDRIAAVQKIVNIFAGMSQAQLTA